MNAHLGQSAIIKSDILPLFSSNGPPVMLYITRLRGYDCRKTAKIVKEANNRNNPPAPRPFAAPSVLPFGLTPVTPPEQKSTKCPL